MPSDHLARTAKDKGSKRRRKPADEQDDLTRATEAQLATPAMVADPRAEASSSAAVRASVVTRLQRLFGNAATGQVLQRVAVQEGKKISGYVVTRHAAERAQERGITRADVENAISSGGKYRVIDSGGTVYYDASSQLAVIVDNGRILTTYYGPFKRARWK